MPAATKQRAAERRRQARAEKKKDGMGSVVGCMMCWGPVLFLSGCTYAAQYYSYQAVHDEMVSRYSAAVAGWQEEGREVLLNGDFELDVSSSVGAGASLSARGLRFGAVTSEDRRIAGAANLALPSYAPLHYALNQSMQLSSTWAGAARLSLKFKAKDRRFPGAGFGSAFVLPDVKLFSASETEATAARCRAHHGRYNLLTRRCTRYAVLSKVCLKLRFSSHTNFRWELDKGGGDSGCNPLQQWQPAAFAPYKHKQGDSVLSATVEVELRSAVDPYIVALAITNGSLDLDNNESQQLLLGASLMMLGCAFSYPWCLLCKRSKEKRKEMAWSEEAQNLLMEAAERGEKPMASMRAAQLLEEIQTQREQEWELNDTFVDSLTKPSRLDRPRTAGTRSLAVGQARRGSARPSTAGPSGRSGRSGGGGGGGGSRGRPASAGPGRGSNANTRQLQKRLDDDLQRGGRYVLGIAPIDDASSTDASTSSSSDDSLWGSDDDPDDWGSSVGTGRSKKKVSALEAGAEKLRQLRGARGGRKERGGRGAADRVERSRHMSQRERDANTSTNLRRASMRGSSGKSGGGGSSRGGGGAGMARPSTAAAVRGGQSGHGQYRLGSSGGGFDSGEGSADFLRFASEVGLDLQRDEEHLWLVEEARIATALHALEAELPKEWSAHGTDDGRTYFYNRKTDESTYTHPLASHYRHMVSSLKDVRGAGSGAKEPQRTARPVRGGGNRQKPLMRGGAETWSADAAAAPDADAEEEEDAEDEEDELADWKRPSPVARSRQATAAADAPLAGSAEDKVSEEWKEALRTRRQSEKGAEMGYIDPFADKLDEEDDEGGEGDWALERAGGSSDDDDDDDMTPKASADKVGAEFAYAAPVDYEEQNFGAEGSPPRNASLDRKPAPAPERPSGSATARPSLQVPDMGSYIESGSSSAGADAAKFTPRGEQQPSAGGGGSADLFSKYETAAEAEAESSGARAFAPRTAEGVIQVRGVGGALESRSIHAAEAEQDQDELEATLSSKLSSRATSGSVAPSAVFLESSSSSLVRPSLAGVSPQPGASSATMLKAQQKTSDAISAAIAAPAVAARRGGGCGPIRGRGRGRGRGRPGLLRPSLGAPPTAAVSGSDSDDEAEAAMRRAVIEAKAAKRDPLVQGLKPKRSPRPSLKKGGGGGPSRPSLGGLVSPTTSLNDAAAGGAVVTPVSRPQPGAGSARRPRPTLTPSPATAAAPGESIGGQLDGADDYGYDDRRASPFASARAAVARPREVPCNTTSSEGQDVEHQPGPATPPADAEAPGL